MGTASPSRSFAVQSQSRSRRSAMAMSRSEWVSETERMLSPTRRSPSRRAAPPVRGALSSARIRMAGSVYTRTHGIMPGSVRGLEGRSPPTQEETSMTPPPRKDATLMDADVREKIHLEILKRTGAYHANDHILLPSRHHTTEYIEKTLVTTEPSFTEGLGAVVAKHFAPWPLGLGLLTRPGAAVASPS